MHARRRKKRQNYAGGIRTVEVDRGFGGFGFTISGQQPVILSQIVPNSPADCSGLRAGDFLISVNGLNVSKLPHDSVVQLIANAVGTIRMAIAENYYSDSSDDDIVINSCSSNGNPNHRARPKYPHKARLNRGHGKIGEQANYGAFENHEFARFRRPKEETLHFPSTSSHSVIHSPNASDKRDITNVSAMVRTAADAPGTSGYHHYHQNYNGNQMENLSLEYRVVVGYLGTIEMPKQIETSSKLQTVKSCIRKMRQEKRNPNAVLMTLTLTSLTLTNTNNVVLVTYPASRLSYVSSNSDTDNKYFGLVTSAVYVDSMLISCDSLDAYPNRSDIVISNSCHVFMIDQKLVDHHLHVDRAKLFRITCTKDPISQQCLEFPSSQNNVVNLIRSMYTLKSPIKLESSSMAVQQRTSNGHVARSLNFNGQNLSRRGMMHNQYYQARGHDANLANSPQPSNHSEITTTSSNSDSGIGFHNDFANISDRIVVVDFPGLAPQQNLRHLQHYGRPVGIKDINDISLQQDNLRNVRCRPESVEFIRAKPNGPIVHAKSKSADFNSSSTSNTKKPAAQSRLTVRAMPDPKVVLHREAPTPEPIYDNLTDAIHHEVPVDVPAHIDQYLRNHCQPHSSLAIARSCDDITTYGGKDSTETIVPLYQNLKMSVDNISMIGGGTNRQRQASTANTDPHSKHLFRLPMKPVKKQKKVTPHNRRSLNVNTQSPTVQALPKNESDTDKILSYKLSPKVFGLPRPISMSLENLTLKSKKQCKPWKTGEQVDDFTIWGSLQELRTSGTGGHAIAQNGGEAINSEPDLRCDGIKPLSNGTSPFRRWGQSSLRSRSGDQQSRTPLARRPSSLAASENDVYTKSIDDDISSTKSCDTATSGVPTSCGVVAWSQSFEKLLDDVAGLHAFAEFLKKEFSAENIYFWAACERYRLLDDADRPKEAFEIFAKHLGSGALEPVNVDSQARNTAHDNLDRADRDLFMQAQKQIFNLMKFDSYPRFIKSDLFKTCEDAEAKNLPLPYPGEQLDVGLRTGLTSPMTTSKLKKSLSNAEDRRRKSLLPWHRKTRCKSKDRADIATALHNATQSLKLPLHNSQSDIHSSRSSLSSFDAALSASATKSGSFDPDDSRSALCRVILADGATTVTQTRSNETVRDLIERLLEKRGILYHAFETFLAGSTKPIDLESCASNLAGKEVQIEQRVIFKLDLPNRKVISVKSKPCKALGDVLRPILHKYNYRLDLVQVFTKDSTDELNMALSVTAVDGHRLQIVCKSSEDWPTGEIQQITSVTAKLQKPVVSISNSSHQLRTPIQCPPIAFAVPTAIAAAIANSTGKLQKSPVPANPQQNTLDEITNKVFSELLQGKVDSHAGGGLQPPKSDHGSVRSEDWGSETSSSGIFGRLRRLDSSARAAIKLKKNTKSSTAGSEDGTGGDLNAVGSSKKPLIAKWKTGAKLQVPLRSSNDEHLEGILKRAQQSRLEDQRGTEINFELPDFLKNKENYNQNNNKMRKSRRTGDNLFTSAGQQLGRSCDREAGDGDERLESGAEGVTSPPAEHLEAPQQRPQPAPRLSLTTRNLSHNPTYSAVEPTSLYSCGDIDSKNLSSGSKNDSGITMPHFNSFSSGDGNADTTMVIHHQNHKNTSLNSSNNSEMAMNTSMTSINSLNHVYHEIDDLSADTFRAPPLPPKPKILPIKPSNWGQTSNSSTTTPSLINGAATKLSTSELSVFKMPQEKLPRPSARSCYLDQQTSSSFV